MLYILLDPRDIKLLFLSGEILSDIEPGYWMVSHHYNLVVESWVWLIYRVTCKGCQFIDDLIYRVTRKGWQFIDDLIYRVTRKGWQFIDDLIYRVTRKGWQFIDDLIYRVTRKRWERLHRRLSFFAK